MGPLQGIRVIELGGIGPVPFAGMLFSDLGADVIRVERSHNDMGTWPDPRYDVLARGRRSIAVDLKSPRGVDVTLRLVERADALIEGFRPGVAERLGLGPERCNERNPRLVYGRMTGWGQEGPWAQEAGHDLDYIAVTGALHAIGPADAAPVVPLNLIGDFGGGALYLALGVVSALLEARSSGHGQVVDAAMVDGAASLMAALYGAFAVGYWRDGRGLNLLDGGAPFYCVYETADALHVAVGAIEPQFYAALLRGLGLASAELPGQHDREAWPDMKRRFAEIFRTKTRDEWCAAFAGTDACVAPVLSLAEAPLHAHMQARQTFVDVGGIAQPAPAPRFSRTRCAIPTVPVVAGSHSRELLREAGYTASEIAELFRTGAVSEAAA